MGIVGNGGAPPAEYFDHEAEKRQRRNLVLISIWMILFLLGGVDFYDNGNVPIAPLVPFVIKSQTIVEYAMYGFFMYFWWRYSHHVGEHHRELSKALYKRLISDHSIEALVVNEQKKQGYSKEGYSLSFYLFKRTAKMTVNKKISGVLKNIWIELKLPLFPLLFTEIKHQLKMAMADRVFSEFVFPHLMAGVVAVLIGIKYFT